MLESEISKTEKSEEQSPYAYLNRDFSSENFKIEVKNMPKFYGFNVRGYIDMRFCYHFCCRNFVNC